ncbi:Hypothetical predicted protein [Marmota monax]|uniref:alpha-N-acetylgalactosaminide alpha-2,6-sialyltransferase n=1 Tax=Marmota monax TaxID=9995 RepID=A0A5E4ARP3_MARMO|nr:Hypothetical predicted protein [Marmota monax]
MRSPRGQPFWLLLLLAAACAGILLVLYSSPVERFPGSQSRARDIQPHQAFFQSKARRSGNTKSRPCPHPLDLAILRHQRFRKLFDLSTPVLLWGGLFTPELWDNLRQQKGPYGWQGLSHQTIASTLSLLNSSENERLFAASAGPSPDCIRCAVVGNGGILNGSRQGLQIDAHDYVFRLNGAVIKGFEQDVGTKTSFYGFTVNTMKNSLISYQNLGFTSVPQGQQVGSRPEFKSRLPTPELISSGGDHHVMARSTIASTLSLLNSSENERLFAASGGPSPDCIRCAVVGNGGILNGSRQGLQIDAHDYVFRLNGAVIKGFEQDVGTKTSFYGFTVNTMKNSLISYQNLGFTSVPQGQDLRYIFIPSSIRDYLMLRSAILGVSVPEGPDKGDRPRTYFGPEASASKFKLLHPEFISYLTKRFLKSKLINTNFGDLYMPSTGALMLLTALHTCDQVSAYGFITKNYQKYSDHYFERVKKPLIFYANHDLPLEAVLWRDLHKAGILWLYQR